MSGRLCTPLAASDVAALRPGDMVTIWGNVLCGRDAVLPRIAELIADNRLADLPVSLDGAVIFHTAVSPAGLGPTTSNKADIEGTMEALSAAGVRLHLGKGNISRATAEAIARHGAVFAVTLPTTALIMAKVKATRVAAFPELGMEALHEVEMAGIPAIIAAAGGEVLGR